MVSHPEILENACSSKPGKMRVQYSSMALSLGAKSHIDKKADFSGCKHGITVNVC